MVQSFLARWQTVVYIHKIPTYKIQNTKQLINQSINQSINGAKELDDCDNLLPKLSGRVMAMVDVVS